MSDTISEDAAVSADVWAYLSEHRARGAHVVWNTMEAFRRAHGIEVADVRPEPEIVEHVATVLVAVPCPACTCDTSPRRARQDRRRRSYDTPLDALDGWTP